VEQVWTSTEPGQITLVNLAQGRPCLAGQQWNWDGVEFAILHPALAQIGDSKRRGNDRSCVLRISAGGENILLTADIEQKAERELLLGDHDKLPAKIMLVPHHGSRTSSSEVFLAGVNPQIALVAAGYRNRFGHPKNEILDRYRLRGVRIYRTDLDGALTVTVLADGGVGIVRHRATYRRYWHAGLENPDVPDEEPESRTD
jgi:competence protein ComEC